MDTYNYSTKYSVTDCQFVSASLTYYKTLMPNIPLTSCMSRNAGYCNSMLFMNKHHKVSFSYDITCTSHLTEFCMLGLFRKEDTVMVTIRSMQLINLHFWTYLKHLGLPTQATTDKLIVRLNLQYHYFKINDKNM